MRAMQDIRSRKRQRRRYRVTVGPASWFTIDVCSGGFCTELMRVLPVRTAVEGSIDVKGTDVPFAGKVAWARPGEWRLNLRGRMGVHFTRIEPDLAQLLDAGGDVSRAV
jgi:hypothetical protein